MLAETVRGGADKKMKLNSLIRIKASPAELLQFEGQQGKFVK